MRLEAITADDFALWETMQCDPVMMAELGGPQPRERMPQIFANTLGVVENGTGWVFRIIPDEASGEVAGSVCIWESEHDGQPINEAGWMILPAFQGRGLATEAMRAMLDMARTERRWDVIHAFPGVTNASSNGICRKLGFTQLEACDIDYSDRILRCNHWQIDVCEGQ